MLLINPKRVEKPLSYSGASGVRTILGSPFHRLILLEGSSFLGENEFHS